MLKKKYNDNTIISKNDNSEAKAYDVLFDNNNNDIDDDKLKQHKDFMAYIREEFRYWF